MTVNGKQNVELIRDLTDSLEKAGTHSVQDIFAFALLVEDAMPDGWTEREDVPQPGVYGRDTDGFVRYARAVADAMERTLSAEVV